MSEMPTTGNRESVCAILMHMERYSKLWRASERRGEAG